MAWTEQILILRFQLHVVNSVNFVVKLLFNFRFQPCSARYGGGNKMRTYVRTGLVRLQGGIGAVTNMKYSLLLLFVS